MTRPGRAPALPSPVRPPNPSWRALALPRACCPGFFKPFAAQHGAPGPKPVAPPQHASPLPPLSHHKPTCLPRPALHNTGAIVHHEEASRLKQLVEQVEAVRKDMEASGQVAASAAGEGAEATTYK